MKAEAVEVDETFFATFGVASALALMNSYLVIAFNYDAFTLGMYDKETCEKFVSAQEGTLKWLKETTQIMNKSPLTNKESADASKPFLESINKLMEFTAALDSYFENPTEKNNKAYAKKRDAAYKAISELVGFEF